MGGYYILKWFGEPGDAPSGEAIGDKLNQFSGGRLGFLMDGARQADAVGKPDDHLHGGPKYEPAKGEEGSKDEKKNLIEEKGNGVSEKAGDVKEKAAGAKDGVDGVKGKADGAKDAVTGATGV